MRLSVDPDDPGYMERLVGAAVKVFLDGVERAQVFTADTEKRLVVVPVLDANGRMQLNADRTGVLRETLYGHVRIELPPRFSHG